LNYSFGCTGPHSKGRIRNPEYGTNPLPPSADAGPLIRRQSVAVSSKPLLFLGQLQQSSKNFQFATAANTRKNTNTKRKGGGGGSGSKSTKTPNTFLSNVFLVQSEINGSSPAEEARCEAEKKNFKLKTMAKVFNVRLWARLQVQAGWPTIG